MSMTTGTLGQAGGLVGDLTGDAGGVVRGVGGERVEPDRGEALAHGGVTQVLRADAVAVRVGEGRVGGARAAERGVELEVAATMPRVWRTHARICGGGRDKVQ
ncbi:MAG TPA: hypothetical protein P5537_16680 [Thauera sp.]|uniref:hypothetical protein n=1 Tax=Thauera sp. TaxID=1905334 RepID=UPI002633AA17|nr:hypothetical protein [Thauera sp.]MCP5224388.1 hypothetical protein [Thauera sp.]HRV79724.1 hypothetical protein [Thauera sp.]